MPLLHDIRYSLRTLVRSRGYTAVALLTLALGIGATTAMFTIVNGILLRPLPYAEPEALVRLYQASPEQGLTRAELSPVDFADWREQGRAFDGMAAYWSGRSTLFGDGEPAEVSSAYVTEDFFPLLGVPMRHGRALDAADLREQARVAVIGERLWRTRYGARPDVLGSVIQVGGEPMTVVGIAPSRLAFPQSGTELWLPHSLLDEDSHGPRVRDNRHLDAIARLAPGVSPEQAQADLSAIAARLAAENPDTNREWGAATVAPLREVTTGGVDRPLLVVLAVVALVLLIGCANLANLMLARASSRQREIAVRTALGAGRWRIVRQLSTEALVLSMIGGALGLLLAVWCVDLMLRMSADTLPRVEEVSFDPRVIVFGFAVALLTSVLFGLLPAIRVVRAAPQEGLRGGRGAVGSSGARLRGALVVSQVMLAVLLVVASGLMARSFLALRAVDPGFQPERVLTVEMTLNIPAGLSGPDGSQWVVQRKEELEERLAALPGVEAVGTINRLPLGGEGEPFEFRRTGADGVERTARTDARFVSPGYFGAMRIPLLAGEPFAAVPEGEMLQVVISESTARRLWPDREAMGQRMIAPWGGEAEVVGIVGDVRQSGLSEAPHPAVYLSQFNAPRTATALVLRTIGDPAALTRAVRAEILAVDASQPIRSITPLREVLAESIARNRFFTLLFGVFAALALTLAAIGIYGVLAFSVGQRTREIGVRMALGARAGDVLAMVLRSGMTLVGSGVVLGLVAALLLTRVMTALLYDVSPRDPITFLGVPVLLGAVALLASYVPARRATRVHPMIAMRNDG